MEKPITGYLDRRNIITVTAVLRSGGISVLPTDTLYGFHCKASALDAIRTILNIKGERKKSGLILLAHDIRLVDELVSRWPGDSRPTLSRLWPASLTAILPSSATVHTVLSRRGRIAVRIPDHKELRTLISMVGEPLVSTSVNISGRNPMTRMREIKKAFPGLHAYVSRRGRASGLPSTVVDFSVTPPRLIRAGRYAWPPGKGA